METDYRALAWTARRLNTMAVGAKLLAAQYGFAADRYLLTHHRLRREARQSLLRARFHKSLAMEIENENV